MRTRRIKVVEQTAIYHCVTRCVGGAMLLDASAKEVLRKQIAYMADFCGVEVITYCVMSNHFHVLVRVPNVQDVSDTELVRRYSVLYRSDRGLVETLEADLRAGGEHAEVRRKQLLSRMGDVSSYMKELKQRFSIWYNKSHKRYGTLWAERFKSTLVENSPEALRMVAAYIDLNPVRAGIVNDPADYRWCGYAEALGGSQRARRGLCRITEKKSFEETVSAYRCLLYGVGQEKSKEKDVLLDRNQAREIIDKGGKLPVHQLLRLRVRYFTDGAVLGGDAFVKDLICRFYPLKYSKLPATPKEFSPEIRLRTLRSLRTGAVGG